MKKQMKKLTLAKETVRSLDDLASARGGDDIQSLGGPSCTCSGPSGKFKCIATAIVATCVTD